MKNTRRTESPLKLRCSLADLEKAFGGNVHELYDHKDAVTMTDKLELLETLDKTWRGKRCSVVTLVLK